MLQRSLVPPAAQTLQLSSLAVHKTQFSSFPQGQIRFCPSKVRVITIGVWKHKWEQQRDRALKHERGGTAEMSPLLCRPDSFLCHSGCRCCDPRISTVLRWCPGCCCVLAMKSQCGSLRNTRAWRGLAESPLAFARKRSESVTQLLDRMFYLSLRSAPQKHVL